jgi:hypothetical protein
MDAPKLQSSYYTNFDLVFYANIYGYDASNIVSSSIPFITISPMHTDEMHIGTGENSRLMRPILGDCFNVVNNTYYPTCKYKLGLLTIESLPLFYATEATENGTALITAIYDQIAGYYESIPDYHETSEYMIGSVAVGVIFLESNGTVDKSTEDWASYEESQVIGKISYSLGWWSRQNPNARLSFFLDVHYKVPTGYEPITRKSLDNWLWISDAMAHLGYFNITGAGWQLFDYLNCLRYTLGTEWAFAIFVVDASNDADGLFEDKLGAFAECGIRRYIVLPVKRTESLEWVVAHEVAHVFGASDEYNGKEERSGYLDISDIEGSGCIMDKFGSWSISGKPHGMNGTWGQIGWRDSDGDGIPDIVDTLPKCFIILCEAIEGMLNFRGQAFVPPYPNSNPSYWVFSRRPVTISKIQLVQYAIDNGPWFNATVIPTKERKLLKGPTNYYITKESLSKVNFTFLTQRLEPGAHFIEVRAVTDWGNLCVMNITINIVHDIEIRAINPYRTILANNSSTLINVTVWNEGNFTETFTVTMCYNGTQAVTQDVTLNAKQFTVLTFQCTTPEIPGNYAIEVMVSIIPGENEIKNNVLSYGPIRISIAGDINADKKVNILDISMAARAFGSKLGEERFEPNADINEDRVINIIDISGIAREFGQTD